MKAGWGMLGGPVAVLLFSQQSQPDAGPSRGRFVDEKQATSPNRQYGTTSSWLVASLLCIVCCLQVGLLWLATKRLSPTCDEYGHLVAGIEYWRSGELTTYWVNPPLVKLMAAVPAIVDGTPAVSRLDFITQKRPEFDLGHQFSVTHGTHAFELLVAGRRVVLFFAVLGTLGVFFAAARVVRSTTAGLIAGALWAFNPFVLGHGALVSCDVPAAAMGIWASMAIYSAVNTPAFRPGVVLVAGIWSGSLLLTKFTWWPLLPVLMLASLLAQERTANWRAGWMACLAAACIAWLMVGACYGQFVASKRLGDFRFESRALVGENTDDGNRFSGGLLAFVTPPVPEVAILGIDDQWEDFDVAKASFLNGTWKEGGWLHYYLVALGYKLPLALIVLFAVGFLHLRQCSREAWVYGSTACVLFVLVSLKTNMNEHVRYLIPVLPMVCIVASCNLVSKRFSIRMATAGLAVVACAVGLLNHPHGIAYANVLAGGTAQCDQVLTGSNVDWGQGWYALEDEVLQETETPVVVFPDRLYDLRHLGGKFLSLTTVSDPDQFSKAPFRFAIGIRNRTRLERTPGVTWFDDLPKTKLAYSIEVYDCASGTMPADVVSYAENYGGLLVFDPERGQ